MSDAAPAGIGHNQPPDPLDEALSPFSDYIAEAENWCDGAKVENDGQEAAVDALIKQIKAAEKAVGEARDAETKPLHDQWKEAVARWKPTVDDLDRIKKSLLATVGDYKRAKAAKKAEAERLAREEAERKARAAEEALRAAKESADLEARRAAVALDAEAKAAEKQAKAASKEAAASTKGTRTVHKWRVTDHKAAAAWIWTRDREALTAFVEDYARRNHRQRPIDGVEVWTEQEAF